MHFLEPVDSEERSYLLLITEQNSLPFWKERPHAYVLESDEETVHNAF